MSSEELLLWIGAGVLVVGAIGASKKKKQKEKMEHSGIVPVSKKKLPEATVESIYNELEKFRFKRKKDQDPNKNVHEKTVQAQLYKHLVGRFGQVTKEYSIEGEKGLKIDFDIDGKIGVEVKMMRSLMRGVSSENQASGQVIQYSKRKYGDQLILLMAMQKEDKETEAHKIESIYQRMKETGATCIIVEV